MKQLLSPLNLYNYQREAIRHQIMNPKSMLWLGCGLGKTSVTLTTIVDRMNAGQVKKTLIFGPLRVIQAVWTREARKWEHTKHLRFSVLHGNAEKRSRALFADADVYLCNYENMNWLVETLLHYYIDQKRPLPFEFVVYDEISKLKNANSMRMSGGKIDVTDADGGEHVVKKSGWKKIIPHVQYATGLTGSPASNGYIDLHGQYLAIDNGDRLGKFITHFRDQFFQSDHMGWSHAVTDDGKQAIEQKISDITVKMDSREYLDLPDCTVSNMFVKLPPKARKAYEEVEKDLFTALDDGSEIELFSKSSVSNKCLQFCNGSPYLQPENPEYRKLHNAKLDALKEIIDDAGGSPIICSYSFKPDAERIMKKFNTKKFRCVNMGDVKPDDTEKVINEWNAGKIKMLVGHAASMGHGLDGLQDSGHIVVWFGCNWSLELYEQLNQRVDRNGQTRPVSIIRILAEDTVDLAVIDALERKDDDQNGLKNALQRYRDGVTTNDLEFTFF